MQIVLTLSFVEESSSESSSDVKLHSVWTNEREFFCKRVDQKKPDKLKCWVFVILSQQNQKFNILVIIPIFNKVLFFSFFFDGRWKNLRFWLCQMWFYFCYEYLVFKSKYTGQMCKLSKWNGEDSFWIYCGRSHFWC